LSTMTDTPVVRLTGDFTKHQMARAVPGAVYDRDEKAWVLPDPTPRGALVALRLFPDLRASYPQLEELRDLLDEARDVLVDEGLRSAYLAHLEEA